MTRPGYLTIRSYYEAFYNTLGATLRESEDNVTHQRVRYYAVDVPVGNTQIEARLLIGNPFPLLRTYKPPVYLFNFEATIVSDLQAYNILDLQYKIIENNKIYRGYRGIQSSHDVFINVIAPSKEILYAMLVYFFRRYGAPYGILWVKDSLNNKRPFSYQITAIDDITELTSLFERYVGVNITLTIFCEVHFWESFTVEDLNPVSTVIVNLNDNNP